MNTPDLYGAWLTAGNNLQPVGAWLARHWPNLAVAILLGAFAWWSIRRAVRKVDRILAEPPARETEPGRDCDLLLTCIATYGDCEELDRLRDAIDQTRKETDRP